MRGSQWFDAFSPSLQEHIDRLAGAIENLLPAREPRTEDGKTGAATEYRPASPGEGSREQRTKGPTRQSGTEDLRERDED